MRKANRLVSVAATFALCMGACSEEEVPSDAGGPPGNDQPGNVDFGTCYAQLKPNCVASEMDTAEKMQQACKSLTNIPIPLQGGGNYGPVTINGGPYGGKIDWNMGAGTPYANDVNPLEDICDPTGIETFNEPASVNAEIENLRNVDWGLYTIFRPACFKPGETYPVITWANGTCGEIAGYSGLLSMLASHGFVVIAANSTWTGTPPTDGVQLRALDYAQALNEDAKSVYYHRLDLSNIGAMGHSQGAAATGTAASDPRVKSIIFWNTGTSNDKPFLDISGERDVVSSTPQSMASDVSAATKPGAWVYFHKVLETGGSSTGHLTLMEQPDRVINLAVAWW
jgi:hypothetical protein